MSNHYITHTKEMIAEEVRAKYSLTFATLCFLVGRADIALEVALLSRLCNKECKIMLK